MKKQPIILLGGGGHCLSCIDVIEKTKKYYIIGILDPNEEISKSLKGYKILGDDSLINNYASKNYNFLITVGQIKSSSIRKNLHQMVKNANGNLPVIISPLAYVSESARIDEGTIVMHHALINTNAKIGKNCIINSKALIEHEATVGDFCHISTAACINGQVKVGSNSFIGSNSVIGNNIQVANNIVIAAGSQVLKDITVSGVYIGNPLKKIR